MEHHFDIEIAKEYGVLEAILLQNFWFWIEKNKANEINFFDGDYWTYNSTKAYSKLFPYVTQRQIQNALKHLRDEDILKTGNYNTSKYDRTLWYAFTLKGKSIMQKCKMEDVKKGNGYSENVQPIPDNKPYNKNTDSKTHIYNDEFEQIWEEYPRKQGKSVALKAYIKARKNGVAKDTILTGIKNYVNSINQNKTERKYIKQGSTWFNQQCWDDNYSVAEKDKRGNYTFGGTRESKSSRGFRGKSSYDIEELMKIK